MASPFDHKTIQDAARRQGVRRVRIIGSHPRREQRPDSDLDLPVDLDLGRDPFDIVDLGRELEAPPGVEICVLTEKSLSPYVGDCMLREGTL
jgi:predicted nucleotidyltransferase